ncbi:MAG: isoprenylcysteine carboxylmethyltransferase family protein [Balneolaceae bacterium]|nr:isoprenylcysteine carboxylmethyltransferase family protein [Balneolaceae bacterium]
MALSATGFAIFAASHTLLAKREIKERIFKRFPGIRPVYRISYTVLSTMLLGTWYWLSPFPDGFLYEVPYPYALFFHVLQLAGGAMFVISLRTVNLMHFLGIEQCKHQSDSSSDQGDRLVTRGIYSRVRHPLYTASMMILLFHPIMSNKLAFITVLFGLYFWIGSVFEERNLVAKFGRKYKEYQRQVPRFIPNILPNR